MNGCIAYGDCNTEGVKGYHEPGWAEMVAEHLGLALTNCGHTMSTTRELLHYAEDFPSRDSQVADAVISALPAHWSTSPDRKPQSSTPLSQG